MGFLGAIFIISQGVNISSKSVVLAQKAASKGDSGWIQVVNNVLSDRQTDAVHPVKAATNKLALEANAPQEKQEKKPAVPGKLDALGVGVDSWPWEKQQQATAAARGSVRKDDLVREIMANFGDTAHRNPMYRGVGARRTTSLEAALIGKTDDELPKRIGRLPIDTCSEDTPNCNKLRLSTAVKVDGWPWDKPENISAAAAEPEEEEQPAEASRPTMLRVFRRAARAARGAAALRQSLLADARAVGKLAHEGVSAAEEEAAAQALQRDSFLMSAAEAGEQQSLASVLGLDKTHVACNRPLGGCNITVNVTNATNDGWELLPGWYWLPKTAGGEGLGKKGINVDNWIFGAVKWQRHAAQQLKEDAADMAQLADSDAASPTLRRRVALGPAQRAAWEGRVSQQLANYAGKVAAIQKLDTIDGCKCAGSSDEDRGPRCSCAGQPAVSSASGEFSPEEITSWD
jgi:hypothetical protein